GQESERKSSCSDELDVIGNRKQVYARHRYVLRIPAVGEQPDDVKTCAEIIAPLETTCARSAAQARVNQNPGAHCKSAFARLEHHAGDIASRDVWQRNSHAV